MRAICSIFPITAEGTKHSLVISMRVQALVELVMVLVSMCIKKNERDLHDGGVGNGQN